MTFRKEEKFPCSSLDQKRIYNQLIDQGMQSLFPERKISSIYFDSKLLNSFKDSQEGSLPRKKIRIRHYPDEKLKKYNLEIKISSIEGRFKTTLSLNEKEVKDKVSFGLADKMYGVCYPLLEVSYSRSYYKFHEVRITFDTEIKYKNLMSGIELNDPNVVIEMKAEDRFSKGYLESLISIPRRRFSKFSRGIEMVIN